MGLNPQFGSGIFYGAPTAGNMAPNPTPMQFGILQEVSIEFKADLKKLFGQSQFPMAKARGKIDVTAKGKIASLDPNFFSQLYFGQPTTAGVTRPVYNESHTPGATVTPTNAVVDSNLVDWGVVNGTTGLNMIKVAASPAVGQYTFTQASSGVAAVYGFNASETAATVLLSYGYIDSAHGTTLEIANELMGYAPEFQALLYSDFRASLFALQLNSCILGSLTVPTKQEDFWISDFDLDASADASGVLGYVYSDQA